MLDPTLPLASNRFIPIEPVADYSEGMVSIIKDPAGTTPFNTYSTFSGYPPYPPILNNQTSNGQSVNNGVLMVEECPGAWTQPDPVNNPNNWVFVPNEPTSWFWNIRIGEKIQINNTGPFYTVVGPLFADQSTGNPERFVNDGPPGATPQLTRTYPNPVGGAVTVQVEYLFLVNGQDDIPKDGFVDNLWAGNSSNDCDAITNQQIEFESETWLGALSNLPNLNLRGNGQPDLITVPYAVPVSGVLNQNYTISRRPVPIAKGREIQLPSDVVIDLTTTLPLPSPPFGQWAKERSRIPMQVQTANNVRGVQNSPTINQDSGYVDILVYPDGSVATANQYSSPASVGLQGSFLHFWLAERIDVIPPNLNANPSAPGSLPYLPIGEIQQIPGQTPTPYGGPRLKGEYRLVTVFMCNGQIVTNDNVVFDNPALAVLQNRPYYASLPFLQATEGLTGGQ